MDIKESEGGYKMKKTEAGLPSGYYTLGDGHIHKIPTTGWSKWYKRGTRKYRYDIENKELVLYLPAYDDDGNQIPGKYEEADRIGLSFTSWIENPDYWVDEYNADMDSIVSDFDLSEFIESNDNKNKESVVEEDVASNDNLPEINDDQVYIIYYYRADPENGPEADDYGLVDVMDARTSKEAHDEFEKFVLSMENDGYSEEYIRKYYEIAIDTRNNVYNEYYGEDYSGNGIVWYTDYIENYDGIVYVASKNTRELAGIYPIDNDGDSYYEVHFYKSSGMKDKSRNFHGKSLDYIKKWVEDTLTSV